jgi:hypothetical protein
MVVKYLLSGVIKVRCPILVHDDDFCLLDNCRYYEAETETCAYSGRDGTKNETDEKKASPEPELSDIIAEDSEEHEQVPFEKQDAELSAKEIWDRLKSCNETAGIPDYDGIIGALIKIVNNTPGVHYLTPKSMDFWYRNVRGLVRFSHKLHTTGVK